MTTAPTCTTDGYDIKTCSVCSQSIRTNVTATKGHSYANAYSMDNEYHWRTCSTCGDVKDKAYHDLDDDGVCTVCEMPISSTPGVVYDVSADGTYAGGDWNIVEKMILDILDPVCEVFVYEFNP